MIFDTHAHYDDEAFNEDREELLGNLQSQGIGAVVNIGASIATSRNTIALTETYPFIYGAIGVHPNETAELDEAKLAWIKEQAAREKIVAIGEIGLDYYWDEPGPRDTEALVCAPAGSRQGGTSPHRGSQPRRREGHAGHHKGLRRAGYGRRHSLLFLRRGDGQRVSEHGILPGNRRRRPSKTGKSSRKWRPTPRWSRSFWRPTAHTWRLCPTGADGTLR